MNFYLIKKKTNQFEVLKRTKFWRDVIAAKEEQTVPQNRSNQKESFLFGSKVDQTTTKKIDEENSSCDLKNSNFVPTSVWTKLSLHDSIRNTFNWRRQKEQHIHETLAIKMLDKCGVTLAQRVYFCVEEL